MPFSCAQIQNNHYLCRKNKGFGQTLNIGWCGNHRFRNAMLNVGCLQVGDPFVLLALYSSSIQVFLIPMKKI